MFLKFAFGALCFALPAVAPADLTPVSSRKAAPDFTLSDSMGAAIKPSNYKGSVVLLDFWATWCEGCKVEIPWYMEFQNKYKKSGLSVVGVAMDDDGWKSVKPFLEEKKVNYPVVIGSWELAKPFGIEALPVTLLIDRNGKIADLHVGMVDKDAFEKEIQVLLKETVSKKPDK
jgi:cytochrome c biogenesis protein CcmG/thiol:disulfide interchange protein DsbE